MKKYVFSLLTAALSLQTSAAFAFGFGGCCEGESRCRNHFDGLYLGANLGVITQTAFRSDYDRFLTSYSGWTSNESACIGGGQIGWDKECNGTVLGLVWDFNGTSTNKRVYNRPNTDLNVFINNKQRWLTTFRGRAGLTVCDALLYVTGGLAVAHAQATWNDDPDRFSFKKTRYGWAGGVGSEFVACGNWTFGFDLLFMQFGLQNKSFKGTLPGSNFNLGHSDELWVGRFLINYRFEDLCSLW